MKTTTELNNRLIVLRQYRDELYDTLDVSGADIETKENLQKRIDLISREIETILWVLVPEEDC